MLCISKTGFAVAASALALCLTSAPAQAGIIFNNGAPFTDGGGDEMTLHNEAEDFSFATATTVGGAGVYVGSFAGDLSNWDGAFQYAIYGDAGGHPAGAALTSGSVAPTTSETNVEWFNGGTGNAFLFQFDFNTPFAAAANTTYWLGVHAAADYDSRDDLYFATTYSNGTVGYGQLENQGDWHVTGHDHAFYLTDGAQVVSGGVPEPASWALMILGFGLAGSTLRGRRVVAALAPSR